MIVIKESNMAFKALLLKHLPFQYIDSYDNRNHFSDVDEVAARYGTALPFLQSLFFPWTHDYLFYSKFQPRFVPYVHTI